MNGEATTQEILDHYGNTLPLDLLRKLLETAEKKRFTDLTVLVEPFSHAGRSHIQDTLLEALQYLAERNVVTPLYEVWRITRHPRVTALLSEGGWIADFSAHLKVFRCLESGNAGEILRGGAEVVLPLANAARDADAKIREAAVHCLERLTHPDALDALASLWVESRSSELRRIVGRGVVARKPPDVRVFSALAADRADLLHDEGPEVVRPLLDAASDADSGIAERAAVCLRSLYNQEAVDVLCDLWAHLRTPELERIILDTAYVAAQPATIRVLSALKTGTGLEGPKLSGDLIPSLVLAAEDQDSTIRERALSVLDAELERAECQEALCRSVIEQGNETAERIARQRGLAPRDAADRALFYFLSEQWGEYESLDFDMSLLTRAYANAGRDLRSRIAQRARRAGRLELVELVAGVRHKRRMGEMTTREWDVTLAILEDRRDWDTMWRMAQVAPPVWSVRAFRILRQEGWLPDGEEERRSFESLLGLAMECDTEAPILGMVDRPTAKFAAHGRRVSRLIVSSYFRSTLASASWDGSVRIWSMPDGRPMVALSGHRHPVSSLAANPDGSVIVSGSGAEPWVILWSMPEGKPLRRLDGHRQGVAALSMSPDGTILAAGCFDGSVKIWRVRDGELLRDLHGHDTESIRATCFSPHGDLLATGSEDGRIVLWEVAEGRECARLTQHGMAVRALVFSPDGKTLMSAGADERILIWAIPDGSVTGELRGHTHLISSLAVSGDGKILASGSWDRTIRLWIMPEGRPWGSLHEHEGPVTCLANDPESRVLVSGGHDCTVVMWNFQSGILRRPTTRKDLDQVESLARNPGSEGERRWLDFLLGQMRRRWRFDIEVAEHQGRIEVGEFDIEVEG